MARILAVLWACCAMAGAASMPAAEDIPSDWPPLPDFKHPVDYAKWLQDRLTAPADDDARPLWNMITEQQTDTQQVQQAKARMWAYDEQHGTPGLFTGDEIPPDHYAWEPGKHPQWETAYQAQVAAGLPAKLVAISQHKHASQPFALTNPVEMTSRPAGSDGKPSQAIDPGLTADDHLIINILLPSLAPSRSAAKILLQNAWRAPEGHPSPAAMQEAIRATLGIADQTEPGCLINHLVNIAIRSLVYDNALRALRDNVFDKDRLTSTYQILTSRDDKDLTQYRFEPSVIAGVFDVLQFIYRPRPDGQPKADMARLRRIAPYLQATFQPRSEHGEPPLDLVSQIGHCDPQTAVRQAVDLLLRMDAMQRSELPQVAMDKMRSLNEEFKHNPENHVLVRAMAWDASASTARSAQEEARRRATQLLYALYIHHNRTGRWPATLQSIPGLPRIIRIDPFSRRSFCYRIVNDQPLLYSVAWNGKDDGGKHDSRWGRTFADSQPATADTDYVFWPIQSRHP